MGQGKSLPFGQWLYRFVVPALLAPLFVAIAVPGAFADCEVSQPRESLRLWTGDSKTIRLRLESDANVRLVITNNCSPNGVGTVAIGERLFLPPAPGDAAEYDLGTFPRGRHPLVIAAVGELSVWVGVIISELPVDSTTTTTEAPPTTEPPPVDSTTTTTEAPTTTGPLPVDSTTTTTGPLPVDSTTTTTEAPPTTEPPPTTTLASLVLAGSSSDAHASNDEGVCVETADGYVVAGGPNAGAECLPFTGPHELLRPLGVIGGLLLLAGGALVVAGRLD